MIGLLKVVDAIMIIVIIIFQLYYILRKDVKEDILKLLIQVLLIITYIIINKVLQNATSIIIDVPNPSMPLYMIGFYIVKYILGLFIIIKTFK